MAISQTMSNPNDWLFQPYQNDFSHNFSQNTHTSPVAAAASAAAATRANLSPEQGRVAKPARRRSRASRRTPTTLLNTDTANFRAMVQHFTGGAAASGGGAVSFAGRGAGPGAYMQAPATATGPGAGAGFHVEYPNQLQQQQMFVMEAAPPQAAARISYDHNYMG